MKKEKMEYICGIAQSLLDDNNYPQSFEITEGVKVYDSEKFFTSHIAVLKKNYKNPRYKVFAIRLYNALKKLNKIK